MLIRTTAGSPLADDAIRQRLAEEIHDLRDHQVEIAYATPDRARTPLNRIRKALKVPNDWAAEYFCIAGLTYYLDRPADDSQIRAFVDYMQRHATMCRPQDCLDYAFTFALGVGRIGASGTRDDASGASIWILQNHITRKVEELHEQYPWFGISLDEVPSDVVDLIVDILLGLHRQDVVEFFLRRHPKKAKLADALHRHANWHHLQGWLTRAGWKQRSNSKVHFPVSSFIMRAFLGGVPKFPRDHEKGALFPFLRSDENELLVGNVLLCHCGRPWDQESLQCAACAPQAKFKKQPRILVLTKELTPTPVYRCQYSGCDQYTLESAGLCDEHQGMSSDTRRRSVPLTIYRYPKPAE